MAETQRHRFDVVYGAVEIPRMEIIEDSNLTCTVTRSWRERLFSWCPWRRTRTEPDPTCYMDGNRVTLHPLYAQQLRETFRK